MMIKTITKISLMAAFALSGTFCLNAQTTWNVNVVGFGFSPSSLIIEVGDEVIFTNSTGTGHNVNGTTGTFPGNPESFGNSVGSSWTYSFTFNNAGSYSYRCDPHAGMGMAGQITVNTATGIAKVEANGDLSVYPNPAETSVTFNLGNLAQTDELSINIYNALGEKVKQVKVGDNPLVTVETETISSGVYFYQLQSGTAILKQGKLMVN